MNNNVSNSLKLLTCFFLAFQSSSAFAVQSSDKEKPSSTQETAKPETTGDSATDAKNRISQGGVKISEYGRHNLSFDLIEMQSRMVGARLKPSQKNGLKGTLDLMPLRQELLESMGNPSKTECSWEINYSGQDSAKPPAASDTEIVGGEVSPGSLTEKQDSCDLLITVVEVFDPPSSDNGRGDTTTAHFEYNYQWHLSLTASQSNTFIAFGKLTGFERKTYIHKNSNGTSSEEFFSTEYLETGEVVVASRTLSDHGEGGKYENRTTTVRYPDGRIKEEVFSKGVPRSGEAYQNKEKFDREGEPFSLEKKWFELKFDELVFVENACGRTVEAKTTGKVDPANSKTAREGDPVKVAAKTIGTVNFVVNGKEFRIEILEWKNGYAHADSGFESSQVYLPAGESYYERGSRLANELGNLITDGRDGEMDYRTTSKDGTTTGLLGSEEESDRFTVSWIAYQLSVPGAGFPFADYLPKDQASLDLLNKLLDDKAMRFSAPNNILDDFSVGRAELYKNLDYYRKRASLFEKAEGLVKEGKLKEAYEMILANNGGEFKDYACKVLDSYGAFAESSK
jgi:hypothetical protein